MQLDPNGTEEGEDLYSGSDGGSNQSTVAGEGGINLDAPTAKWPEYANRIERIDTYKKWPEPKIDVNELSEAGMFYKGEDDRTECYYCGIPLKLWEIHDEPWIEHARFSQDCPFLHFHKGWAFVKAALEFYDLPTVGLQIYRASNFEPGYGTTESSVPVGQSSTEPTPRSTPAPKTKRIIRRVEPGEIWSRLDMDRCKKLMALGYPRELVGQVIGERLQTEADDFDNYGELVAAVMNAAENLGIPLHTTSMQVPNTFSGASGTNARPKSKIRRVEPREIRSIEEMDTCSCESFRHVTDSPLDEQSPTATARLRSRPIPSSSRAIPRSGPYPVKKKMSKKKISKIQGLLCTKCNKNVVNVIFEPCDHRCLCDKCAVNLHNCPKCHKHISKRLRVSITVDEL